MELIRNFWESFRPGLPLLAALVLGVLALAGLRRLLDRRYRNQADRNMRVQLIMLLLSCLLLIVLVIVSPIPDSQKGQVLSLLGIVLSAAIALSSTTFLGNAMAGLMLRSVRGFRIGDFISVGEHFGRVSERGLFHVEIQTEQRDLISVSNLHLVTTPVKTIRSSGTIVWTEVSLGYDVPRSRIKDALLAAASDCELQDPYVHVMSLGDFSVVYRVSGLLTDVKTLISTRARLRAAVLDRLHAGGIEIVSPSFMNTRAFEPKASFIPRRERAAAEEEPASLVEDLVFDKAEEAESLEQLRRRLESMAEEAKALEKALSEEGDAGDRTAKETRLQTLRRAHEILTLRLQAEQKRQEGS